MPDVRWSHSSLKQYEQCARQYHAVQVLKRYPRKETEATRYGTDVHAAIENYVLNGVPLPAAYERFKPVVDAVLAKPGNKLAEHKMALTKELAPCEWDDPTVWVRGIADILVVDEDNFTVWCADWKTGSNKYPDRDQLVLMSLLVFAHFPTVQKVNSALLFLVKDSMVKLQMRRTQAEQMWWKYRERVARIEASFTHDVWNPRQSPLCGWCVVETCEHHPNH